MSTISGEQRQYERHRIENSMAILPDGVFQLSDISLGGFCFKCPVYTSLPEEWKTDILGPFGKLEFYPVKKVWATVYENDGGKILSHMYVGAKFAELTEEQGENLAQMISFLGEHFSARQ